MKTCRNLTVVFSFLAVQVACGWPAFAPANFGGQAIQSRPELSKEIRAAIEAALKLPLPERLTELAKIAKQADQAKDIPGEIMALFNVGINKRSSGRASDSLADFESALALSRTSGDRFSECDVLCGIGDAQEDLQQYSPSVNSYEQALTIATGLGYRPRVAQAAGEAGLIYARFGKNDRALALYEQALKTYQELNQPRSAAGVQMNIGALYQARGQNDKVLPLYEQALQTFQSLKLTVEVAEVQANIGVVYVQLGENDKALPLYEQALNTFKDLKLWPEAAQAQMLIGNLHQFLGEHEKALSFFGEALKTFKDLKLPRQAAAVQMEAGNVYVSLGQNEKALPLYEEALKTYGALKLPKDAADVQLNMGTAYTDLGQKKRALSLFQAALKAYEDMKLPKEAAASQMNIALIYREMGQNDKAVALNELALRAYQGLKLRKETADAQMNIGPAYLDTGQTKRALSVLMEALKTYQDLKLPMETAVVHRELAATRNKLGEFTEALVDLRLALPTFQSSKNRLELARTNLGIALAYDGLGQPEVAVLFGKQAVNVFQSLRSNAAALSSEIRKSFAELLSSSYRRIADMLIKQGRITEAERVLALLKEDERFEFLRRDPAITGVMDKVEFVGREQGWLERWKAVEGRAVAVSTTIRDLREAAAKAQRDNTPFKDDDKLKTAILDQDASDKAMAAYFDALKIETADHAKILAENRQKEIEAFRNQVQGPLRRLEASARTHIAAVYGLDYEGYAHFIVATPTGETPISVKVDVTKLNAAIADLRAALTDPSKDPKAPGMKLYEMVLAKPIGQLHAGGIHHVMWSLDGALRYIPLSAVWNGHKYLVETDSFTAYSPLELEKLDAERSSSPRVAAFGATKGGSFDDRTFSALPNVKKEVDSIVKNPKKGAYGSLLGDPWLDAEFTSNTFLTQMASDYYRICHIASHFDLRSDFARSALLTGDQKLLSLRDIVGSGSTLEDAMRKKPWAHLDLVVLSACDTAEATSNLMGPNDENAGAETESFASMVVGLGASSVMASLWSVSDASTSMLMSRFYKNWGSGMTKAEALRQAQLSLLHTNIKDVSNRDPRRSQASNGPNKGYKAISRFDHPYYWAPFVLYGNWR